MLKHLDTLLKLILIILPLLISITVYISSRYSTVLESTKEELLNRAMSKDTELFQNILGQMQYLTKGKLLPLLKEHPAQRRKFEVLLSAALVSDIQYLYLIQKDKNGAYRFILDTEKNPLERSEYGQYFNPVSDIWDRAYKTKKAQNFRHVEMESLWVTLAIPVVQHAEVTAVLGADISYTTEERITKDLRSFYVLFSMTTLFLILLLVAILVLAIFYQRRRTRSFIDPLTQCYNRAFLYEVIEPKYKHGYQLLIFDIDYFKKVNDTYGHDTGDKVLRSIAHRIRQHIRNDDYFIRFGGEEFLLFMKIDDKEQAINFAERLRKTVASNPFVFNEQTLHITISMGLNPILYKDNSMNESIDYADKALYIAKQSGRNCLIVREE